MTIKTLFLPILLFHAILLNNKADAQGPPASAVSNWSWHDTDGNIINAHGAGVLYFNGTYFLFGEIKKGKTWKVPNQDWEDYRVPAGGVSCYSSSNLKDWKYKGVALSSTTGDTSNDLDTSRVIERPKVIYNRKTKKFVMWMHMDKNDYSYSQAGVAISDKPEGPYKYLRSVKPNGQMSRDMTLFKDDDGKAYLIYSSEQNNTMQACLLSDDYQHPTKTFSRILINEKREAPALFKSDGKYYLITSSCTGWSPNPAKYAVADHVLGPWKQYGNPCIGEGAETTFDAQSTYVLPLKGKSGKFLFMADIWNKTDLENSGYLWLPLTLNNGKIEIRKENSQQGDSIVRLAKGAASIVRKINARPFSIVSFGAFIKTTDTNVKASSFIRFYDAAHKLLLEDRSNGISSANYRRIGNYTEAPSKTSYMEIGLQNTSRDKGFVYAHDFDVQNDVGTPKVKHQPICNLDQYMKPFWKSDTVYNETILLYSSNSESATGKLLYNPDRVISVKGFDLKKTYKPKFDYNINGNVVIKTSESSMPFVADTTFDRKKNLAWFDIQSKWVVVTYTHHDRWKGYTPSFKGAAMPNVMARLKGNKSLKIVAYGMSITRGMDVSGYDDVAPFMPTYVDLFTEQLKKRYHNNKIQLYNAGLPGSTVDWGAKYADEYVGQVKPDLVIVDFGMNDFWRLTPSQFEGYIQTIMTKIRARNPAAEFILLSNMKFDPEYVLDSDKNKAFYVSNLQGYSTVLKQMETKGVVNLNMYDLSSLIYEKKKAKDCICNPLHPNDYLARWYAQGLAALLISSRG